MNDLMTDSSVVADAMAQEPSDDAELRAFLTEADAAKSEMTALRDELSRLRSAHEASKNVVGERAETRAALDRLLGSARRLRARLASMDRRTPAPVAAAAGLRVRVQGLTADVLALRRQVSAERRDDAARLYAAVTGIAPTEEQLDRLLLAANDPDAAMRAALLRSADAGEEQAAEVERGLLELQQLFRDMAALVDAQGARVDDIERHVAASAGDVGAAEAELTEARRLHGAARVRRRRVCLAAGVAAALVLVAVALAVVAAIVLARRGGGGQKAGNLVAVAADLLAR